MAGLLCTTVTKQINHATAEKGKKKKKKKKKKKNRFVVPSAVTAVAVVAPSSAHWQGTPVPAVDWNRHLDVVSVGSGRPRRSHLPSAAAAGGTAVH